MAQGIQQLCFNHKFLYIGSKVDLGGLLPEKEANGFPHQKGSHVEHVLRRLACAVKSSLESRTSSSAELHPSARADAS